MKTIVFDAQYNTPRGSEVERITMTARDINSGIRKATSRALSDLPPHWDLCAVTFMELR